MPTLRVMSWNLRTLGSHQLSLQKHCTTLDIILKSQADIVCIQELMIGRNIPKIIGYPISNESVAIIQNIVQSLNLLDPTAQWDYRVSGINSGSLTDMRDAYAFLWKTYPATSKDPYLHVGAVDRIQAMTPAQILRQPGKDRFPGRRPGMLSFGISVQGIESRLNIVSYHALLPCSIFGNGKGAGTGINALATLTEIGGTMCIRSAHTSEYKTINPLPATDTIVLGDLNYDMNDKDNDNKEKVFNNLLTNYQPCISSPDHIIPTTYSPDATMAYRFVSSYDNIFVLKKHDDFIPKIALVTGSGGCIDFIGQKAAELGAATGIKYCPTEAAWYVIHKELYARQHKNIGISDHMPVWADFNVNV